MKQNILMQEQEKGFNFNMTYFDELKKSMDWLGQKKDTIFIGQAVAYPGTAMSNTLKDVDQTKLIELPVAEEFQMGMSLGLSLNGTVPISIFPRWNFLICGMNQLVNHIDKIDEMGASGFNSKIIIRTGIGSERPLHPQFQHVGDYTKSISEMCKNIDFIKIENPEDAFEGYKKAYNRTDCHATVLVEYGDYYSEK